MSVTFGELQRLVGRIIARGPKFLGGRNILTFLESSAAMLDGGLEALNQGVLLAHPLGCDASALPQISRDRRIKIYPTEPEISKRFRLSRWLQLRRQFDTHQGEMRNVQPMFLPATPVLRVVHQDGLGNRATWHTLDASGVYSVYKKTPSNWNWDGQTTQWSRFWVIVYTDQLGLDAAEDWDDGQDWDGGSLWGGSLTFAQITDIVDGIREAKGAASILWGLILASDPASFDPTASVVVDPTGWSTLPNGKWGYSVDPVTGQPTRLPTASYPYNLGQG
jgi:hypothetical protein